MVLRVVHNAHGSPWHFHRLSNSCHWMRKHFTVYLILNHPLRRFLISSRQPSGAIPHHYRWRGSVERFNNSPCHPRLIRCHYSHQWSRYPTCQLDFLWHCLTFYFFHWLPFLMRVRPTVPLDTFLHTLSLFLFASPFP